ncbi:hypothetical protein EVAR_65127_1 [Eumeta japonica]|uniref:Uncharacterized protein n=1 Tax=Eumeta variegata TaxID=151549 RepID=A0A4C1Z3X9_EUMVA|nr:hypothetical protein EVAR_65127_1 [Eumeta japonica]
MARSGSWARDKVLSKAANTPIRLQRKTVIDGNYLMMPDLLRQNNTTTRAYHTYLSEENRIHVRSCQSAVKERMSKPRNDIRHKLMQEMSPFHQAYR